MPDLFKDILPSILATKKDVLGGKEGSGKNEFGPDHQESVLMIPWNKGKTVQTDNHIKNMLINEMVKR